MINLKEVAFEDIDNLTQLASKIWHEYWVNRISFEQVEYMLEQFQSKLAITNQIKNENYIYFYILKDENIVGYVGLSKKEDYLFLSKFYIKKDYRHSGIGSKTFEFIKNFAKNNEYKRIILTVNKYNIDTINAYKNWNFNAIEAVVTDIGNGFVMDDYIMEYRL